MDSLKKQCQDSLLFIHFLKESLNLLRQSTIYQQYTKSLKLVENEPLKQVQTAV